MQHIKETLITLFIAAAALGALSQISGCAQEIGSQNTAEIVAKAHVEQAKWLAEKAKFDLELEALAAARAQR